MVDHKEDHPGILLVNSMLQASKVRDAIRQFLLERKVVRFNDYRLMVDFTMNPDRFSYEFCLRVFPIKTGPVFPTAQDVKKPVLTLWSPSRDGLVANENMAMLLILYNS